MILSVTIRRGIAKDLDGEGSHVVLVFWGGKKTGRMRTRFRTRFRTRWRTRSGSGTRIKTRIKEGMDAGKKIGYRNKSTVIAAKAVPSRSYRHIVRIQNYRWNSASPPTPKLRCVAKLDWKECEKLDKFQVNWNEEKKRYGWPYGWPMICFKRHNQLVAKDTTDYNSRPMRCVSCINLRCIAFCCAAELFPSKSQRKFRKYENNSESRVDFCSNWCRIVIELAFEWGTNRALSLIFTGEFSNYVHALISQCLIHVSPFAKL